ncbi:MAG: DNA translocase FtsK 4TM domain-containing protein, partial [Pseudomonadota bacterium]
MAEAIEKRGKELLGLVLIALAGLAALMIGSYHPDDPNWMVATDTPVRNWLGSIGASIAAPLFMIVGWGAWGLAIVPAAWGARFVLHKGNERAIGRLIFAPIWIALLALYASSLTPNESWLATHSFGLGGLFGDTVLGALLGVLPVGASMGLKALSILFGICVVALGVFVLGFTRTEISRFARFLLVGIILIYASIRATLGFAARGSVHVVSTTHSKVSEMRANRAERRLEAAQEAEAEARVREPVISRTRVAVSPEAQNAARSLVAERTATPAPEKSGGLLSRMPSLIRKPEPAEAASSQPLPTEPAERVSAKIADAIRQRVNQDPVIGGETNAVLTK